MSVRHHHHIPSRPAARHAHGLHLDASGRPGSWFALAAAALLVAFVVG